MIELKPLSTSNFNATRAEDLNDVGQVVGKSFVHSTPFSPVSPTGPYSTATAWENGIPSALSSSTNRSEAFRINNKGEVLCLQFDHPRYQQAGDPTCFLWKEGVAIDLATLVPGLRSVVDLNDNSVILGLVDSGAPVPRGFIYDLNVNARALLPPLIVNGNESRIIPIGIDNLGRVVVTEVSPPEEALQDIYWLPPGGPSWINSGIQRSTGYLPSLSKSGWILAVAAVQQLPFQMGCYLDLNNPNTPFKYIPPFPDYIHPSYNVSIPFDASAPSRIVGQEAGWDGPLFYDAHSGELYKPTLPPSWSGWYANGINAEGQVIVYGVKEFGTPDFQMRGVVIEWPAPRVRLPLLSWLLLLGGVIQDGGGIGITYGGRPIPIDPWGPLLTPEKRDILLTLAFGEFAALLSDPELRQIVKRAEIELLEKASKIAIGNDR